MTPAEQLRQMAEQKRRNEAAETWNWLCDKLEERAANGALECSFPRTYKDIFYPVTPWREEWRPKLLAAGFVIDESDAKRVFIRW